MDISRFPKSERVVVCPSSFDELKERFGYGVTAKSGKDTDCDDPASRRQIDVASKLFENVNQYWRGEFKAANRPYRESKLHYSETTRAACVVSALGTENMAAYCPTNSAVYLGFNYIDGLKQFRGEKSDFAPAMILAHEVAHHVQEQMGLPKTVRSKTYRDHPIENQRSIAAELQADCYAGAWAGNAVKTTGGGVSERDVMEVQNFIISLGDGPTAVERKYAMHGTGEERLRWFAKGFKSGRKVCNTFEADQF